MSLPPHLAHLAANDGSPAPTTTTRALKGSGDILEDLVGLRRDRVPCALCTVVESGGSSPRKAGAKMIVLSSGATIGTIGGGAIELEVIRAAVDAITRQCPTTVQQHLTHDLGMCCGGKMAVFVEPQRYQPRLLVFGAGHVGLPVAQMAHLAGFEVTVVDQRPEWASPERFGEIAVLAEAPISALQGLEPIDGAYVVVLTHDHDLDFSILESVAKSELAYLGVIGSVRKGTKFRQRLAAAGYPEDTVTNMRSPMGVDIGAVTPAEIAVSVVAELVKVRRMVAEIE